MNDFMLPQFYSFKHTAFHLAAANRVDVCWIFAMAVALIERTAYIKTYPGTWPAAGTPFGQQAPAPPMWRKVERLYYSLRWDWTLKNPACAGG